MENLIFCAAKVSRFTLTHWALLSWYMYKIRGGSRAAATSKMECFVIIVNDWKLEAVNYYRKELHLGCCSSPRSASENGLTLSCMFKTYFKNLALFVHFSTLCMKEF